MKKLQKLALAALLTAGVATAAIADETKIGVHLCGTRRLMPATTPRWISAANNRREQNTRRDHDRVRRRTGNRRGRAGDGTADQFQATRSSSPPATAISTKHQARRKIPRRHVFARRRRQDLPRTSGTYWADSDDGMYLAGMTAGSVSKTGKLGFVAAFQIPQLIRSINAFTLGAQSVNPKATTTVVWTGAWWEPQKETEAVTPLPIKASMSSPSRSTARSRSHRPPRSAEST